MLFLNMIKNKNILIEKLKKIYPHCREKDIKYIVNNLPTECFEYILITDDPDELQKVKYIWKISWLEQIAALPDDEKKITAIKIIAENISTYKFRHIVRICENLKKQTLVMNPDKFSQKTINKQKIEAIAKIYGIELFSKNRNENICDIFEFLLYKYENSAKMFYILNFEVLYPVYKLSIPNIVAMSLSKIMSYVTEKKYKPNQKLKEEVKNNGS